MKRRDWAFVVVVLIVTVIAYVAHARHTCIAGLFGGQCHGDLSR